MSAGGWVTRARWDRGARFCQCTSVKHILIPLAIKWQPIQWLFKFNECDFLWQIQRVCVLQGNGGLVESGYSLKVPEHVLLLGQLQCITEHLTLCEDEAGRQIFMICLATYLNLTPRVCHRPWHIGGEHRSKKAHCLLIFVNLSFKEDDSCKIHCMIVTHHELYTFNVQDSQHLSTDRYG